MAEAIFSRDICAQIKKRIHDFTVSALGNKCLNCGSENDNLTSTDWSARVCSKCLPGKPKDPLTQFEFSVKFNESLIKLKNGHPNMPEILKLLCIICGNTLRTDFENDYGPLETCCAQHTNQLRNLARKRQQLLRDIPTMWGQELPTSPIVVKAIQTRSSREAIPVIQEPAQHASFASAPPAPVAKRENKLIVDNKLVKIYEIHPADLPPGARYGLIQYGY